MRSTTFLAIALALVAGCKKPAAQAKFEMPPAPVQTFAAETRDVPVYLDEIGRTVAREVVSVQPQISGRITEIHFVDGADLKAGDPLFSIDARPFQTQLDAALATLAQSRATLDLARVEFTRSTTLLDQKAISRQDFDTTKSAVAVAEARVKQNEAAIETAKLNLEYCAIKAPIDGRAGQRLIDIGNIVEGNRTVLLVIQRLDPIYAEFTIAEKNLASVQDQMAKNPLSVEVRLPEGDGAPVSGDLTFLNNAVDPATGTVKLRATLSNPQRRLWPGLFVKVRLVLTVIKDAVLVPSAAVQLSAKGPYLFVAGQDSTAQMRPVKLGQRHGDRVVVEEGIQAGEPIVTTIHQFLYPGGKIQVVKPPAEGAKP